MDFSHASNLLIIPLFCAKPSPLPVCQRPHFLELAPRHGSSESLESFSDEVPESGRTGVPRKDVGLQPRMGSNPILVSQFGRAAIHVELAVRD